MFHRLGHFKSVGVLKGDKVKKGQLIGTLGTGNGQWSGHLHYDIPINKLSNWTAYVFGLTKDQVKKAYADPAPFRKIVLPSFDHFGWKYLEYATYGTKKCYHPGEDLNGPGAGNADVGLPIYSPCDGEVVYCYNGTGTNAGWGKLAVIQEAEPKSKITIQYKNEPEEPQKPAEPSKPIEAPKPLETAKSEEIALLEKPIETNTQTKTQETPPNQSNVWDLIINLIKKLYEYISKK